MRIDKIADEITICANCPFMCKDVCTIYSQTKVDSLSPSMHEYLLRMILDGREKYSEEVARIMYKTCCSCLLCQAWCATSQDVPEKVRTARADIVDLNLMPNTVQTLNESTLKSHNPFQEQSENRFVNLEVGSVSSGRKADVLYFVGCTTAYRQPEIAQVTIATLKHAKIDFDINREEWCCGLPQFELGLLETSKSLAQHNKQVFENNGYRIVVTSCPECYYMFKQVYPKLGFPLKAEILHTSEYIRMLLGEEKLHLKKKLRGRTTYHDPCYLGRHCKIYDDPRLVIKHLSTDFVEMRWNKDKAYCGGSGVAYSLVHPEISVNIARKVLEEAEKIKTENLITSCPMCKNQLLRHLDNSHLKIYDLMEAVGQAVS